MKITGSFLGRIKKWVATEISIHKAIANAHHAKYTNAEAVSAVDTADEYIRNGGDSGFRAKTTGAQTVPSGEWCIFPFNNEIYDINDEYNPGNYIFTAKKDGYYLFTVSAIVLGLPDGCLWCEFIETTVDNYSQMTRNVAGGNENAGGGGAVVLYLTVGQTAKVKFYQNSGSAKTIYQGRCHFSGYRIG